MRILSYETVPRVKLVSREGPTPTTSRCAPPIGAAAASTGLVFLVDAPAVLLRAARARGRAAACSGGRPRAGAAAPARARDSARVGAAQDRRREARTDEVQRRSTLIDYFRGFEAGAAADRRATSTSTWPVVARGVCRHRAFAFMITANAAGIATRYVTNEAHAFAEVLRPGTGWLAIDLGGARARARGGQRRREGDAPAALAPIRSPSRATTPRTTPACAVRCAGLSSQQIAEAQRPSSGSAATAGDPSSTEPVRLGETPLPRPVSVDPKRRGLRLNVDAIDRRGFRGEMVKISGYAADAQSGAPMSLAEGLRIDLYLAPVGGKGSGARVVGQTVTDREGKFHRRRRAPR
jgi:hypothetical protein